MQGQKAERKTYLSTLSIVSIFILCALITGSSSLTIKPNMASAATVNAGIVTGIWYSKYPFYADDLINIYSAIQNRSDVGLSGKVGFYIDDIMIGSTNIEIAKSSVSIASIQWKATTGNRAIHAKIIDLKTPDGVSVSTEILSIETSANTVRIEVDPEVARSEAIKKAEEEARISALNYANASSALGSTLNALGTTKPLTPILQKTENSLVTTASKIGAFADSEAGKAAQFLINQKRTVATDAPSGNTGGFMSKIASSSPFLAGAYNSIYNSLLDVSATAIIFWKLVLSTIIVILLLLKARSWAKRDRSLE